MGLVQRLAARKYLNTLRRGEQASAAELAEARTRIIEIGPEMLPALLDLAHEGTHSAPLLETIAPLLTTSNLGRAVEVMAASEGPAADFLERCLGTSTAYDPQMLFTLFEHHTSVRPRLERVLRARAGGLRWDAVRVLLREPNRERIRLLLAILEMRREPQAVQLALAVLDLPDAWMRIQALRYLKGSEGEGITAALAARLKDTEPGVRRAAAEALGGLKAHDQLQPLCHALRDADLQTAGAAIGALVAIGDPGAVKHLVQVLKDESEFARRAAVEVLNEVATPEAIEDLVQSLQDEDWWVRVRAADALGALGGDRVVDAILKLVRSEDVFVRRYAVEILNAIPSERSVPALVEALNDGDWWVRERAVDALGKSADTRAVAPLLQQLRADAQLASIVTKALVQIGDEAALQALIDCLTHPAGAVVDLARKALRELSRTSSDSEVRKGAARVLSQGGDASEWGRSVKSPGEQTEAEGAPGSVRGNESRRTGIFQAAGATRIEPLLPELGVGARGEAGAPEPLPRSAEPVGSKPVSGERAVSGDSEKIQITDFPKLPVGTVLLDRYEIRRKIGEGGFGYVYLVLDRSVSEEIILKILSPQISLDESMIRRFIHELKFNRRIVHPNVIRLYDILELNPGHAISMEYFPSDDLGTILDRARCLDPDRVRRFTIQICQGLKAAHDSGIVHRDIKPPNILIGPEERIKIVDFGLAAASGGNQSRVTKSGILVGTPQYMAPEQIRGTDIDLRTDIYALGALLFECLSGSPPFASDNPVNVLMMHLTEPPPCLRDVVPDVPDDLEWLIETSLRKDPAERPQTVGEILERLERRAA